MFFFFFFFFFSFAYGPCPSASVVYALSLNVLLASQGPLGEHYEARELGGTDTGGVEGE